MERGLNTLDGAGLKGLEGRGVRLEKILYIRVCAKDFVFNSSIQKSEYFNPHEMENDDSPALEQRTFHYCEEERFEEEELWQNGIEKIDYTPPLAKNEAFEVHRYTFKNGKSFISITKQMNDVLPLGRVNGSRIIEKTMKEIDEEGGTTRKT
ncbi:hypothetical protein Tco_0472159 [Tanacetum coccineum]